jgi:hypothetical protein
MLLISKSASLLNAGNRRHRQSTKYGPGRRADMIDSPADYSTFIMTPSNLLSALRQLLLQFLAGK